MYASWSTDLQEHHAHQRKIVRHFAPHLSNDALARQERVYFAVGITRILAVFVVPSVVVLLTHAWFFKTPVFVLVALVAAFELSMAIYRYFVLWPEGQSMRWNYWREIEMAQDCYKLKIMGYYHRKIAKFTGRFPSTMASSEIQRHYRTRGAVMVSLFSIAFVVSLVLLARTRDDETVWTWITYLLAIGSGVVIFRFIKMHFIELPQVLLLRDHPEFAVVLIPPSESIPFARPIRAYDAMEEEPLRVATSLSTEKVSL